MIKRNKVVRLIVLLLTVALLLSSCTANALETAKKKKNTAAPQATAVVETPTAVPEPTATPGPLDEAQRIADYIFEHGELPDNFITKKQAQAHGWDSAFNYVSDVAPGKSIGGDYFGNYEQKLPAVKSRKYYEADCFYKGGKRNAYRIIYSTDGHVWYTEDHYNTFIELFPTKD
jgi:guanyl-specific ribonuclease Sa